MFSAIILACNVTATQCQTFGTPRIFNTERECYISLADGISQVEYQGWLVKNYDCYKWEEKA